MCEFEQYNIPNKIDLKSTNLTHFSCHLQSIEFSLNRKTSINCWSSNYSKSQSVNHRGKNQIREEHFNQIHFWVFFFVDIFDVARNWKCKVFKVSSTGYSRKINVLLFRLNINFLYVFLQTPLSSRKLILVDFMLEVATI